MLTLYTAPAIPDPVLLEQLQARGRPHVRYREHPHGGQRDDLPTAVRAYREDDRYAEEGRPIELRGQGQCHRRDEDALW